MNNPIKSIGILVSTIFMAVILLTATYASKTNAKSITIHSDSDGNNIKIYHQQSDNKRVYEVNGKTIYWQDLTSEQQQRLTEIENKIEQVEKRLKSKEAEIRAFADKLEVKARVIEHEAHKRELATIKIEKTMVSMSDVEDIMERLQHVADVNDRFIFENEAEMDALQEKIEAIDMRFTDDIDGHVDELETVLVAIAAGLN